ncbi:MAG: hypothetical protein AAF387_01625 [Pseudomonadota bacterium]
MPLPCQTDVIGGGLRGAVFAVPSRQGSVALVMPSRQAAMSASDFLGRALGRLTVSEIVPQTAGQRSFGLIADHTSMLCVGGNKCGAREHTMREFSTVLLRSSEKHKLGSREANHVTEKSITANSKAHLSAIGTPDRCV